MMQSYYKPKRKQSKRAVFYRRWRQRDDFGAGAEARVSLSHAFTIAAGHRPTATTKGVPQTDDSLSPARP